MITTLPSGKIAQAVNTVIQCGGRKVSIACDDSCGAMENLYRSDILCLLQTAHGDEDVTAMILGDEDIWHTNKYMEKALEWVFEKEEI
jgi:hypothetical protein